MARAVLERSAEVNPTLATTMVLAADTGARRGELCALRWRKFDGDAGTLRIDAAIGETNKVYEKDTKTHQHRTVALSPFALEWLRAHRDRHANACALCGIELSADAFVLAPEPGGLEPLRPSSATRRSSQVPHPPAL
jgi:integrase